MALGTKHPDLAGRSAGRFVAWLVALICFGISAYAFAEERVERFKPPEFRQGYQIPKTKTPFQPWVGWATIDVVVLAGFLSAAAYLIIHKRSRKLTFLLTIAGLAYFGFWRKGCICPIGATQNVALAAGGLGYALPWTTAAFFVLPLLFALFYGRVFCSGVCPLGAIQDLVLYKPVRVPAWAESALGLIAWAYLGLAVLLAATGSDFFICRYDPFVGFFRMSGPAHMLLAGGILLALCMFVGRVYCRFLCPYSVLLRILSPFSKRRVTITPTNCVDCRLCETSCPFNAIRYPSMKEPARGGGAQKRGAALALAALPLLIVIGAGIGYLGRGALARMDFTVQLAEKVLAEDTAKVLGASDETRAFVATGKKPQQLYAEAAKLQRRFAIGSALFGAWMGLAIGGRILGLLMRKQRPGYTADAAACVACARCFAWCPVENEQRNQQREEQSITV